MNYLKENLKELRKSHRKLSQAQLSPEGIMNNRKKRDVGVS